MAEAKEEETKEIFQAGGAVYALENNIWIKLGIGTLKLIHNPHQTDKLLFKIENEEPNSDKQSIMFVLKPKLKPKGPMSWVLKGIVKLLPFVFFSFFNLYFCVKIYIF